MTFWVRAAGPAAFSLLLAASCGGNAVGADSGDTAHEDGGGDGGGEVGDVEDGEPLLPPVEDEPVCGNGVLDPGEECDDRNRVNGDGCDWLCRLGE